MINVKRSAVFFAAAALMAVLSPLNIRTAKAANEAVITLSPGSGNPGSVVSLNLSINTSAVLSNVSGVQWDFIYSPSSISAVSVTDGPASTAANKNAVCAVISAGDYRCLVFGYNTTAISNGVLSVANFTLSSSPAASVSIQFSGLVAVDSAGMPVALLGNGSTITAGQAADTTAPSVPTGLTASASSASQINLTWSASTDPTVAGQTTSGVTGYKVYRAGVQIGTSATNSYSDTGLIGSTSYTYTVSAYDGAGNNSAQSTSATTSTQSGQPVPGDLNSDHIVNALDYSLLNSKWLQSFSAYDLQVDGLINSLDFAILSFNWGKTW